VRISIRLWAVLAVLFAAIEILSCYGAASVPTGVTFAASTPGYGAPAALPLTSGLPEFPNNLTHFVYVIRENEVFDAYLGDCSATINETCNDGTNYTSQTNHIADVPFLHDWARQGTVFDNMYSGIDPFSAQAHSFLFADDAVTSSGSDTCGSGTVEGTGSGTQWGDYNSSSVKAGSCSWSPDSGQTYPSGGTILDRYTRSNVAQDTSGTPPFMLDGDFTWELNDASTCSVPSTSSIPGSLPGNSVALEHVDCTGTNGWWTNTSSGSVNDLPPVTNPASGVPDILFGCQYECGSVLKDCGGCGNVGTLPDQWAAYGFISYVAKYGLPTVSYIELFDDHPGPSCTNSNWDTCIKWNDQSMNLIVSDIFNSTSAYKDNTVVAISQDDTQDGSNGKDHINSGRRFPFVLVAPPSVMKTGNPNPAACGIPTGPCGNVVHQTFNTSNVLAVEERVELNVNQNIFSTTKGGLTTFPMALNDQLAETNPLEPVWRCADPSVPCNTGTISSTPVLTTTGITPNPVSTTPSGTVALTASALDQHGNPMSGVSFSWTVYPVSLGSISANVQSPTFTAGSSAGAGHICENASAGSVSNLQACVLATVSSAPPALSSVVVSPPSTSVVLGGVANLHGVATLTNGANVYPSTATFLWTLATPSLGSMNATAGTNMAFTAGSTTGTEIACLNVTYGTPSVKLNGCSAITIAKAAAVLTSGTLNPLTITVSPLNSGTQTFYSQGYDQFGNIDSVGTDFAWTLSPTNLGSLSSTSGPINVTTFTAGATAQTGKLTVTITNGPAKPIVIVANVTVSGSPPLTASFTQAPWHGSAPLAVTISGTVSGGSGSGYAQTLTWGDGSSPTLGSGGTVAMSHTYSTKGTYTPSLSVTDSLGNTAQISLGPITVYDNGSSACPLKATASGTPLTGSAPLSVVLTGGESCGTPPYSVTWTFGDGSTPQLGSAVVDHTYRTTGTYYPTFWVNDTAGASAESTLEVDAVVGELALSVIGGPENGTAPLTVSFQATVGGGTAPYTITWQWGDSSSSSTGSTASHTYSSAGTYSISVTATDSSGKSTSASLSIQVLSPPSTPSSGSPGPLGISWAEWGLLLAVIALAAILAVVVVSRRSPKNPAPDEDTMVYTSAPTQDPYSSGPMVTQGPPPMAAPGPGRPTYNPDDDTRAPDPRGGR
jgi:PKD repeat protein